MKTILRISILMLFFYLPGQHLQWGFGLSGPGNQESKAIKLSGDTLICVGTFENTIDADPGAGVHNLVSNGSNDVFLIRYDTDGNLISAVSFGGSGNESGFPSMCVDPYGFVYLTFQFENTIDLDPGPGTTLHTSTGETDAIIAKFDSGNNLVWSQQLNVSTGETGNTITADSNSIYLTGNFTGTVDFDPGPGTASLSTVNPFGIYVAKYSLAGLYSWAFLIDNLANPSTGNNIRVDTNGNVITSGYFYGTVDFDPSPSNIANMTSNSNLLDFYLAKYDENGNYLWAQHLGGTFDNVSYALELSGNDIILGGYIQGTDVDLDPGIPVLNYTTELADGYLARFDPSGSLIWAKTFGGPQFEDVISVAVNPLGHIIVVGGFSGDSMTIAPGVKLYSVSNDIGSFEAYIALFDENGNYEWSTVYGDSSADQGLAVIADPYDNWYFSSRYGREKVDIDPSADSFFVEGVQGYDNLVFKLSPCARMNPELAVNLQFNEDASVSIPVSVTTGTPQSYAWYKDNAPITGAENASYPISPVTFADEGIYKIKVTDVCKNNKWSGDLSVTVIPVIKVYELISPNGDDQNEFFNIRNIDKFSQHDVTVFNRWGQQVFSSRQYANDWNGSELPDGTYFYKVVVGKEEYKGSLLIKR